MTAREFSGRLRERINIEVPADVADGGGGFIRSWSVNRICWAEVTPLPAEEQRHGGHVASHARYRLSIRNGGPLPGDARLRWHDTLLSILSVTVDPERRGRMSLIVQKEREQ
jgi:SPP1 family predicted phage head-tail adaptor